MLWERIGPGEHPCHWCGKNLEWRRGTAGNTLLADHVDGDILNNSPENLVAACNGCNTIRARTGFRPAIDPGELHLSRKDGARERAVSMSCEICGAQFLAEVSRAKRRTVSVCSKRCAGIKGAKARWG